MALQDLAKRSGFTHAIRDIVLLQLELPSTQPELRELFSCQLQVDDDTDWRDSNIYSKLLNAGGHETGVIGTISISAIATRNKLTNTTYYRPLTLFSKESLVQELDNTQYGYSINARVRCLSVEQQDERIWLVRGEILSGGLIFGNQNVIPKADRERVWPKGNLRGIFFTGSELQIEVGDKVVLKKDGELIGGQPSESSQVRIDNSSTNNEGKNYLFRSGKDVDALASAEWHTIDTWKTGIVTLNEPYGSSDSKPKTGWKYEIFSSLPRRFRLLGVNRKPETGAVQRAVWEQISASTALSQLDVETAGLPIEPPAITVNRHFDAVNEVGSSLGITVTKPDQITSRTIVVVDGMDEKKPDGSEKSSSQREFLRIDWKVAFKHNLLGNDLSWSPQTLLVHSISANQSRYELTDNDEAQSVLHGQASPAPIIDSQNATVELKWANKGTIQATIPTTRLIGTAVDAERRTAEEPRETSRELWFQASCGNGLYNNVPLSWANVSAQQPPAVPIGDGARASRLSGPIVYSSSDWTLQATPADPESGRAIRTPGVRLTLTNNGTSKQAKLELFAADVTLDSPKFRIYDQPINDPKSVPNERQPQDGKITSLRFIHRPEWERVSPGEAQTAVICNLSDGKFVVNRDPQAVRIYMPAERALIDPVSVTRGNLIGQQIVAFPLLTVPGPKHDSAELKVTDVRIVTADDKSLTAHVDLELEEESVARDIFESLAKHKGFFAQFNSVKDVLAPAAVLRIPDLPATSESKNPFTLVSPILPGQLLPSKGVSYRLTVGPTRLALPRDVNHGLIPIGVSEFEISADKVNYAKLSFSAEKIRGEEGQSVLALHPWSEWGPSPKGKPWLTTGRVRLHHRNLIQEHAEFESSFEDRFPPEGPAKNPDGSTPSPLLPLADFVRAVRDRYTEASGNLIAPNKDPNQDNAKLVRNWLPGSNFQDSNGAELKPEIAVELNELSELPETKVKSKDARDIGKDPFSYKVKVGENEEFFNQSLKLRKATDIGADQHWLDVSVRPENLAVGNTPTIRLTKTDPTDVTSRRAVDSSVPLLFSRHDICALATIGLDDGRCIAIVGSPEQSAMCYIFDKDGKISKSQAFPGNALIDVALLRQGTEIYGLAIRKTKNVEELIHFKVDPNEPVPKTVRIGKPIALTVSSAAFYVLTDDENREIYEITAKGVVTKISTIFATNATAIGADRVGEVSYLAVGFSDGTVSVWSNSSGWNKLSTGNSRNKDCLILGNGNQKLSELAKEKEFAPRPIRGLCVLGNSTRPIVVAVDGTRFPCVWGTVANEHEARIWLQPSDTLSVNFGRVKDLELRGKDTLLPFIALGLRSGLVRMSAVIETQDPAELIDVRQFDAAETPITRLTLVGSDDATKPAACFAGTSAGGVLAWDVRRGMEWGQVKSVTPSAYLDALGVVRSVPVLPNSNPLIVDELSFDKVKYYSASTPGFDLVVDKGNGTNDENLTDIRLWADSFKVVKADGEVELKKFPDGPFDPGHITFFSKITAADGLKSLSLFDYVPRLYGIPFFVTEVKKLQLTKKGESWDVALADLEGVLINPDEIAAGQDPADAGTWPGVVVRALGRGSKIGITIEAKKLTSIDTQGSVIDWTFSVNRQLPGEGAEGFPAALARIRSKSINLSVDEACLKFTIDPNNSRCLVFERFWPLSEEFDLQLQSHATFRRANENEPWEQTGYSFRTSAKEEKLICDHRWEPSNSSLTISADPKTLVWNGGRYISFHQKDKHQVFVADRMTGLAAKTSIFDNANNDASQAAVPTTAVLETVNEAGEITLTVAAGRVSEDKSRVDFAYWKGESLANGPLAETANKASWILEGNVGNPVVKLCRPGPLSGEVDKVQNENNLARLHAKEGSPLPPSGSLVALITGSKSDPTSARVFGINRETREFSLAQDVTADASQVEFLQFVQRIEAAEGSNKSYTLTLSDSGPTFAGGDVVRVIAGDESEIGKISNPEGPVVTLGSASAPSPGSRLQKLFQVTAVNLPNNDRATVRIETNTIELVDRFISLHSGAKAVTTHITANGGDGEFDLYQPVKLSPLGSSVCSWRAVYPFLVREAKIDIGKSLSMFTPIRITDVVGAATLSGELNVIPVSGTFVLLCRAKIGDGNTVTNPGTWSVNGSNPVSIETISNEFDKPIIVKTTDDHGLTDGDTVEIAGVEGADGVNGTARVKKVSSKEFNVYKVENAPTNDSSGFWERVDDDKKVNTIEDKLPAVLNATSTPEAYSRFRLILNGTIDDRIFVAGPISNSENTWESLLPVTTFDKDSTYWAPMVATIPGNGKTSVLRTRSGLLPQTTSTAVLAYGHSGKQMLSVKNVRAIHINSRSCYLSEEDTKFSGTPMKWTIGPKAVFYTEGMQQLRFDEVLGEVKDKPKGNTQAQNDALKFFEVGICGGQSVAISVDGTQLIVWPIDDPVEGIEPTQTIPVGDGEVLALAVHQVGESLWVAVVRGVDLHVYRIDDAHSPPVRTSIEVDESHFLASFTEHEEDVVVAVSDGKDLKAFLVSAEQDSRLELKPIWNNPKNLIDSDSIISLTGGQDGGAATFLVGLEADKSTRVESWSPSGFIVIRSDESMQNSPRAAIGVDISSTNGTKDSVRKTPVLVGAGKLTARLHPSRRVRFNVEQNQLNFRAFAQLEQDNYRCLTLHPTVPDASRGQNALTLWTQGDLEKDVFAPELGPLELCTASVELEQTSENGQEWSFAAGVDNKGRPSSVNITPTVFSSSLSTYIGNEVVTKLNTTVIDISLKDQTVKVLLESDIYSSNETTAVLILLDNNKNIVLQAVVRCSLNLSNKTLTLVDDVYWKTVIMPDVDSSSADILLPKFAGNTSAFSVTGYQSISDATRGFARLSLDPTNKKLGLVHVDDSSVALIPELEPSRVQAPDRVSDETVRLAHRLRAGLALRPLARTDHFERIDTKTKPASSPTVPPSLSDGKSILLETVVTVQDGPVVRLRPEGWLVPIGEQDEQEKNYRTDGLFVLNVDFRQNDTPVLCAVESRTREFDPAESGTKGERKRYRQLLREAGVQGVAINYRLTDGQEADIGFIDSPYYDHSGELYDNASDALSSSTVPSSRTRFGPASEMSTSEAVAWDYGFDPRLRLPGSIVTESDAIQANPANRYIVADLAADPYADVCCLAHRQYRLQRLTSEDHEMFDPDKTPILHNSEVPAFRQPARLSSPLSGRWMRTEPAADKISSPEVFFPPRIDWELAADKPGAMFQSLVQARVTAKDGATRREPLIDFALREPQFIKLADCVKAEVYWQTGEGGTSISTSGNGYANVNLVWTEVVGSVQVENAIETPDKSWLKSTVTGISLTRVPIQLVIDFNSEVVLVNQADAAVPAYRVEAQPEKDSVPPKPVVLPAKTYLVANPTVEEVFNPQVVIEEEFRCEIALDNGVYTAKFDNNKPLSGTTLTTLQDVSHRFVQPNGQELFELMQDTGLMSGDKKLNVTIGDEPMRTAAVVCVRPLCIEINNLENPNQYNGAAFGIDPTSVEILSVRDGVEATELRLAQLVPGVAKFLVVTPSKNVETGKHDCNKVTTQADGFFEAAVRSPLSVEVASIGKGAWEARLKAGSDENLNLIGEHKLVRLASQNPAVNGVFGVLKDCLLARPVVGNGKTSGVEGVAAKLSPNESSVKLKSVEGNTPIIITLDSDPSWDEGEAVVVSDVTTVPQANGVWVVQVLSSGKEGKVRFALFDPSIVTKDTTGPIDAICSAILPLREAFPASKDLENQDRLRRMNFDPKWEFTDRPLVQIHWAGTAQFPDEDGKGIAWRQGGVMTGMYEQVKQVKFLANSQLSPKLAFVMTAPAGTPWQRTILFGDSAPPFKAVPSITVPVAGVTTTLFKLEIPDNRESLSVPVPIVEVYEKPFFLDLVKSMPSGVAIYARCGIKLKKKR